MDGARTSVSVVFRADVRGILKEVHYSLPRISCDVIYHTREAVFHRDNLTPRRELKTRRAAEYF